MSYSPTQVNPYNIPEATYRMLTPPTLLLPDGEYSLTNTGEEKNIFYIFNSDDKYTGYWVWLEIFDKNNNPIELPPANKETKYTLNALNGKESVKTKKKQKIVIDRFHILVQVYSRKLDQRVLIDRYPTYQSADKSTNEVVGKISFRSCSFIETNS